MRNKTEYLKSKSGHWELKPSCGIPFKRKILKGLQHVFNSFFAFLRQKMLDNEVELNCLAKVGPGHAARQITGNSPIVLFVN